jgi:predicted phosphoribosyltransferase
MTVMFNDRIEAGRALAAELAEFRGREDVVVLGLPRGGVPVAAEVARALGVPLEIYPVRKLGVPGQEELAFGAIGPGGTAVFNPELVNALGINERTIARVIGRESAELRRRERLYRPGRRPPDVDGKTVLIVDDGLATGATMRAAVAAVRSEGPAAIIVAAPVGAGDACRAAATLANGRCVCVAMPEPFYGVGMWYRDFGQVTDDEVRRIAAASGDLDELVKRWRQP